MVGILNLHLTIIGLHWSRLQAYYWQLAWFILYFSHGPFLNASKLISWGPELVKKRFRQIYGGSRLLHLQVPSLQVLNAHLFVISWSQLMMFWQYLYCCQDVGLDRAIVKFLPHEVWPINILHFIKYGIHAALDFFCNSSSVESQWPDRHLQLSCNTTIV